MDRPGFLYLLTSQCAALLQRTGVVTDPSGALALAMLPAAAAAVTPQSAAAALSGPAGIGVATDGTLYIADPDNSRIVRRDGCDGQSVALACFGGPGSLPGQLKTPRGLLLGPRHCLYVADSGNHRVQVVDLSTLQIRAVWGQPDPWAPPEPGIDAGRFNAPWDLAADAHDAIYVVDHGNRRVQKFSADGVVEPLFWETMQAQTGVVLIAPASLAVALVGGQERLLVIDQGDGGLKLYDTSGAYDAVASSTWSDLAINNPAGLSFTGDRLYVGDGASSRIYVFDLTGSLLGVVPAPQGAVCGLALDRRGRLLVHSGSGASVAQLLPGQVYAPEGRFLIGPLDVGGPETSWHRLEVQGPPVADATHLRLYTLTSASPASPPALPTAVPSTEHMDETLLNTWRPAPRDALDLQILNVPGRYLWIAGVMSSDGSATPIIRQLRVEYDHESWLRHLPAVFAQPELQPSPVRFLKWALALFQSSLETEDRLIDRLPQRFDALAAPADGAPDSWLDWLAGWLALVLPEEWSPEQKRRALQSMFRVYSTRGTVEGLQSFIRLYTGASARIIEPAQTASVWTLGEGSRLGFGTMLAAAEAQGAVLGTTATLEHSHLTGGDEYGAPLFADLAHEFCVQVYAAEVKAPQGVDTLRRLIEQEKPAHTVARVQVIDAALRVGRQATLGVDAIVASQHPRLALGEDGQLGVESGLSSEAPGRPGQGESLRLGMNTRLA